MASQCPSELPGSYWRWPSGSWGRITGHDAPLAGDEPEDQERGGELNVLYDVYLLEALAEKSVFLLVTFLVLVEAPLIRDEPEHSSGPVLALVKYSRCFGFFWLFGGFCSEKAIRLEVGWICNILLARSADHQLVASHGSGDLGVALGSITVDSLGHGRDKLVSPHREHEQLRLCARPYLSLFSHAFLFFWIYMTMVLLSAFQRFTSGGFFSARIGATVTALNSYSILGKRQDKPEAVLQ